MAEEAKNKKYLVLDDVRVSYRKTDDTIHLVSTDSDFPQGFHLPLQKGTHVETQMRNLLTDHGHIASDREVMESLPKSAEWHDSYLLSPLVAPTFFPLGIGANGGVPTVNPATGQIANLVGLDLQGEQTRLMRSQGFKTAPDLLPSPMTLILGSTGSGKTVLVRNILRGAALRPDHWLVLGDRPEIAEAPHDLDRPHTLDKPAMHLTSLFSRVCIAHARMRERYEKMALEGKNRYLELESPEKGILLLIEDAELLDLSGVKTNRGISDDGMKSRTHELLTNIAREGRAAGVHLVLTASRMPKWLEGPVRANFNTRIIIGNAKAETRRLMFGEEHGEPDATAQPRGRFHMRVDGQGVRAQVMF